MKSNAMRKTGWAAAGVMLVLAFASCQKNEPAKTVDRKVILVEAQLPPKPVKPEPLIKPKRETATTVGPDEEIAAGVAAS